MSTCTPRETRQYSDEVYDIFFESLGCILWGAAYDITSEEGREKAKQFLDRSIDRLNALDRAVSAVHQAAS